MLDKLPQHLLHHLVDQSELFSLVEILSRSIHIDWKRSFIDRYPTLYRQLKTKRDDRLYWKYLLLSNLYTRQRDKARVHQIDLDSLNISGTVYSYDNGGFPLLTLEAINEYFKDRYQGHLEFNLFRGDIIYMPSIGYKILYLCYYDGEKMLNGVGYDNLTPPKELPVLTEFSLGYWDIENKHLISCVGHQYQDLSSSSVVKIPHTRSIHFTSKMIKEMIENLQIRDVKRNASYDLSSSYLWSIRNEEAITYFTINHIRTYVIFNCLSSIDAYDVPELYIDYRDNKQINRLIDKRYILPCCQVSDTTRCTQINALIICHFAKE